MDCYRIFPKYTVIPTSYTKSWWK